MLMTISSSGSPVFAFRRSAKDPRSFAGWIDASSRRRYAWCGTRRGRRNGGPSSLLIPQSVAMVTRRVIHYHGAQRMREIYLRPPWCLFAAIRFTPPFFAVLVGYNPKSQGPPAHPTHWRACFGFLLFAHASVSAHSASDRWCGPWRKDIRPCERRGTLGRWRMATDECSHRGSDGRRAAGRPRRVHRHPRPPLPNKSGTDPPAEAENRSA